MSDDAAKRAERGRGREGAAAPSAASSGRVKPVVAISMGDPMGIGPEVIVKALADAEVRRWARFHVYGFAGALHAAAERAGIEPFWWRVRHDSPVAETGALQDVLLLDYDHEAGWNAGVEARRNERGPTAAGGAASFQFVDDAIAAALSPVHPALKPDAIVTAPISKEAWALAGRKEPGHTELFAARFHARRVRMMFVSPRLRVILATAHVPLMEVRAVLSIGRVFDTIELGHETCRRLGVARPRIAVCGLNPHAGENGILGDDEGRVIVPAIEAAREAGMEVEGPLPGDTVFRAALGPLPPAPDRRKFDLVVAMYHDQGLIAVKTIDFERAVNVTAGLPIVRTSPDHGTAFDIAGKNSADPGSMRSAIELAVRVAGSVRSEASSGTRS